MDEGSILSCVIIAVLLLLSAYFSATETAFASVSRVRIKAAMDRGDRQAKKAMYVLDHFDQAITTILIGNNIVNLTVAALVTVLVTRRFGLSAVSISTICTTIAVFFAGEMLPKSIGKKRCDRIALSNAGSLYVLMRVLTPLSAVLTAIGNGVAKLTRGDPEVSVTEDELYDIIETMKDDGDLDAEQGELVHSALMFADVTVESVLTARVDVAAINIADSHEAILARVKEEKHSRLPVYRDSIDHIVGILQIRTYIKAYLKQGEALDLEGLLDEAFFVHQSASIAELLPEMSRQKQNIAIVTDNYGGTLGIVTVEDILEELVGEIWDEDDEVVETVSALSDGSWMLDAGLTLEEAFDCMDYSDPEDNAWEHKLLSEWAYETIGHIPQEGDSFDYHDLHLTVAEMRQNRIVKLRASILPPAAAEGGDEA